MRTARVIRLDLYGTSGCHLCEEAEALFREALARNPGAVEWRKIDIAGDAELAERYGVRIPVLCCRDSGEELGWPFDGGRLEMFLRSIGQAP
jgi:hypothetical protein